MFRKWRLTLFVFIALMIVGCSPTSVLEQTETPVVTVSNPGGSSPVAPTERWLSVPPVTPHPGWVAAYKLELDIAFQHPAEFKNTHGNGSSFEFTAANGGFLHFSDELVQQESSEPVEKDSRLVC